MTPSVMVSQHPGGPLNLEIRTDVSRATEAFREARRAIDAEVGAGLRELGQRTVLPTAQHMAGTLKVTKRDGSKIAVSSLLVIKPETQNWGRSRSAKLTTSAGGAVGRTVGLQEYGGTVKTVIKPRGKRKALAIRGGHPVKQITAPRTYRARLFMNKAVDRSAAAFEQSMLDAALSALHAAGFDAQRGG